MSSAARRLARFVTDLGLKDVPAPVVQRAGLLALDTLGCCLAASKYDFARAVRATAERLGGPPESSLVGSSMRVAAAKAALEAIIAGVEVMCRVGLAVPGKFHARHYHPTALAGTFAAAAAAGKLYGLTEDELVRAFGVCGSQAAGIIEYLADGSWTKRLHAGWAAHAGIVASLLARAGFTGPETVLEGEHGFYRAFAGGHEPARLDELLASLGTVWEIEQLTFKPYPCGSIAQPYMDCALRVRHRVSPDDIVEIRCRTAEGPVPRLWEPLAAKHAPQNGYAAKFSLPYLLSVVLIKGRASLAEFEDDVVRDREILALASRIGYELDPTIDYPRQFVGHVRVRLRDGRIVEESQDHPRGGPDSPMGRDEIESKFLGNASLVMPADRASRVIASVAALDTEQNLRGLVESLTL